jgi:hypothetical protein
VTLKYFPTSAKVVADDRGKKNKMKCFEKAR